MLNKIGENCSELSDIELLSDVFELLIIELFVEVTKKIIENYRSLVLKKPTNFTNNRKS